MYKNKTTIKYNTEIFVSFIQEKKISILCLKDIFNDVDAYVVNLGM